MAQKQTDSTKKTATSKPETKTAAKPAAKTEKAVKPEPVKEAKTKSATAKPEVKVKPASAVKKEPAEAKPKAAAKPEAKAEPKAAPAPEKAKSAEKKAEPKSAAKKEPVKEVNSAPVKEAEKSVAPEVTVKPAAKKEGGWFAAFTASAKNVFSEIKKDFSKEPKPAAKEPKEKRSFIQAIKYDENFRLLAIVIASVLCAVCFLLGLGLGTRNCGSAKQIFTNPYNATTAVGYSAKYEGTTERKLPVATKNEGLPENYYPVYGRNIGGQLGTDGRNAVIAESNYLCATGTANAGGGGGYTWMDENGYLYSGTRAAPVNALDKNNQHRQLYKHSASVGMYFGNVSDDEPAIIKTVTMRPRGYSGYGVTGVYAPAGEVIKIEISGKDMNALDPYGITIHIGQALYNGQANNIWEAKGQMQRMAVILNTMTINKNNAVYNEETDVWTGYVGSFLGGPLYIRNSSSQYTVTISGGVAYSHFILGYTTPEEFEQNAKSTAPYFDLEVWDYGVLHSGPKYYAQPFSYDDLYKAAVLWEKISLVSTQRARQGIVFIYDPFVAAGAAVAFPGRRSVNCPAGWMSGSLNYKAFVNGGSWGNMHEYNHNFQGYGMGSGADGEVTNNALNLVSYSLFTRISSARGIESYGASGLGGWNSYTSGSWTLSRVLTPGGMNSTSGLCTYATLLHNFGQDAFMKSSSGRGLAYFQKWEDTVHYNMSYYAELTREYYSLGASYASQLNAREKPFEYPVFVPVASVYQTGMTYKYSNLNEENELEIDERSFQTMQPFKIKYGQDFMIDLSEYSAPGGQYASGSVVVPGDFDYTVKSVSKPEHGKIEKIDDYHYNFKPDKNLRSGEIRVVLELTKKSSDAAGKTVGYNLAPEKQEVELILEFEQSHEMNKFVLERTTYTYTADTKYTDAVEAYNNGYKGYQSVEKKDHANPVQNSNTDIWFYPATDENINDPTKAPYVMPDNSVAEVSGKFYIETAGKYRVYLRGRKNCAVYLSTDGKNYGGFDENGKFNKDQPAARVTNGNSAGFYTTNPETYCDITITEDRSWIHFKSVLIVDRAANSFIGLGLSQWTEPMFTMVNKYYDANGAETDEANAVRTETKYYDYQGREVTEEQANKAELIAPTSARYVNAYRSTYEIINNDFESDYFYTRTYTYSYTDETYYSTFDKVTDENGEEQNLAKLVSSVNATGTYWSTGGYSDKTYAMFDGNAGTIYHSNNGCNADRPIEFVIDMGRMINANTLEMLSRGSQHGAPSTFVLSVSDDNVAYREIGYYTDVQAAVSTAVRGVVSTSVKFDQTSFRYFKLSITKTTHGSGFVVISQILFSNSRSIPRGTARTLDDKMFETKGKWSNPSAESTFGHVYLGQKNSSVNFEFEGKRLGLTSIADYGAKFDVYIDGKKVKSIDLKDDDSQIRFTYISSELRDGKHKVRIVCTGKSNIDSVVTW